MKRKIISALGILLVVIVADIAVKFVFQKNQESPAEVIACTQDAKLCSDGFYVGRTSPKCEFAPCPNAKDENDSASKKLGTIIGKVTIGPLCPVEPCKSPIPDPYSSRQIILASQDRENPPVYFRIDSEGKFQGEIPAGVYKATITDCKFLGCKYMTPKTVVVEADRTAEVDINIDTGIR